MHQDGALKFGAGLYVTRSPSRITSHAWLSVAVRSSESLTSLTPVDCGCSDMFHSPCEKGRKKSLTLHITTSKVVIAHYHTKP